MSSNDAARLVLLVLASIASSVSGFVGGLQSGKREIERQAVKRGHAYYANKDGDPQFVWKEAQP
jgi:hypothetical protein